MIFCFPEKSSALRPPLYFSKSTLEFRNGYINIEQLCDATLIFEDDIVNVEKLLTGENDYKGVDLIKLSTGEIFEKDSIIKFLNVSGEPKLHRYQGST
jgi:hypothetical protein